VYARVEAVLVWPTDLGIHIKGERMPRVIRYNKRYAEEMAASASPELVLKFVIPMPISAYQEMARQARAKNISIAEYATSILSNTIQVRQKNVTKHSK
jgi:hypothetical protein